MNNSSNVTFVTSNFGGMKLSYEIRRGDRIISIESFGGTPDETVRDFWNKVREELGKFTRQGFSIVMDRMKDPNMHWTTKFREKIGGHDYTEVSPNLSTKLQ